LQSFINNEELDEAPELITRDDPVLVQIEDSGEAAAMLHRYGKRVLVDHFYNDRIQFVRRQHPVPVRVDFVEARVAVVLESRVHHEALEPARQQVEDLVHSGHVLPQARQVIVHAEFALHDLDLGLDLCLNLVLHLLESHDLLTQNRVGVEHHVDKEEAGVFIEFSS